ncbi:hypothetical protein LTR91_011780 [Friedmanniomyces endolithicus]|uniref:Uncharacterized protein n=1 Tax=Friedmanniomyces endolithicus TaxID=329885 RepID=A0AAN6QR31_9PEZI|nr:hypothetical protein LTR94_002538 [Friedmanniomyces endolithicus]KAK0801414.1 hypothetical protein LTR59_005447 [Friedmanniomyces endolithicus]KAK0807172.1 hypothetical protein LTR38_005002 [Friedmanniomyces endolithicus]KAK0821177.1 hypothetical protein LTR75_000978 [Friedmanniomyces endolithicus]KAK0841339.1 hypothetical protein LTR03_009999 [Friedmanniomyces endolithicus]
MSSSSSSAMSKHSPSQDLSQLSPGDSTLEAKEHSASGSASAGINLNVFGALAGAFSGKSTKETAADGSSVEYREDEGRVKGAGKGNLEAVGAAQGEEKGSEVRRAVKEK